MGPPHHLGAVTSWVSDIIVSASSSCRKSDAQSSQTVCSQSLHLTPYSGLIEETQAAQVANPRPSTEKQGPAARAILLRHDAGGGWDVSAMLGGRRELCVDGQEGVLKPKIESKDRTRPIQFLWYGGLFRSRCSGSYTSMCLYYPTRMAPGERVHVHHFLTN